MNSKTMYKVLVSVVAVLIVGVVGWNFTVGPGWRVSVVRTSSMEPAVSKGSLVLVRPAEAKDLEVGQIGLYATADKQTIMHRLQAVTSDSASNKRYVFKGDANLAPDSAVNKERVVGRLVIGLPLAGYLFMFMMTWLGLIVCIYIPAVVFIGYELNRLARRLSLADIEPFLV